MNVFNQFGIQWTLLLAQAVNFFILLFILKKFLYSPILKMLDDRKKTIAKSMENAQEIEKKLSQTEEDRQKTLAKTLDEAKEIIEDAKKSASEIINKATDDASKDVARMIKKGQEDIAIEREKMKAEIRSEVSRLVVAGLKVVTGKVLSSKDQEKILENSIRDL